VRSYRVMVVLLAAVLASGGAALWHRSTGPAGVDVPPGPASTVPGPTAEEEGYLPPLVPPSMSVPPASPTPRTARSHVQSKAARSAHEASPQSGASMRRAQASPYQGASPSGETRRADPAERAQGPRDSTSAASPLAGAQAGASSSQGSGSAAGGEEGGAASPAPGSLSRGDGTAAARPAPPVPPVVTAPRVISTGEMVYPGDAFHLTVRRQELGAALGLVGTEGTVGVRALVLADGTVRGVEVLRPSGSPVLDRAAADAVRRWQFAPATRDGAPIDAYVTLRVRYVVR